MIVIKNIDYIETKMDIYEIAHLEHQQMMGIPPRSQEAVDLIPIRNEIIRGDRFLRSDGEDIIVIGLSRQAREVLGIPIDAFHAANKEISAQRVDLDKKSKELSKAYKELSETSTELSSANIELNSLKKAGILTRIKWIFKGVS